MHELPPECEMRDLRPPKMEGLPFGFVTVEGTFGVVFKRLKGAAPPPPNPFWGLPFEIPFPQVAR